MTAFWLIRHGQTDWNLLGRWQGQSPDAPGLNGTGRAQVILLVDNIKTVQFDAIYASDLPRSLQTAELLADTLGLTVTPEPRLREINLGEWEGMLSDDIKGKYPNELMERANDPFHTRAPGGESPQDVAERVIEAVDEIAERHPDGEVILVAHGLSLAVVFCHAEGIPMEKVYEHIPENAKAYFVEWKKK